MNHTLIFLDIDFVLNTNEHLIKIRYQNRKSYNLPVINELIADNYLYNSIDYNNLKPFMDCLEQIPNVKIVLSTSWRNRHSIKDWQIQFDNINGWKWKIIGKTILDGYFKDDTLLETLGGYMKELDYCRGHQIKNWIEQSEYFGNCNYCIIDDNDDMLLEQKDNFVQINYETGFTENDIERVLEVLK
jgi:hypothetical protein